MKIEIDDTQLIDTIVEKVAEQITPLLKQYPNCYDNEILTVVELADYLKVKKSWIYEKVHTIDIPFYKASKFPRFRRKHIDIWLHNPYHPDLDKYNLNHKRGGGK
jgi:excisionase family DNA binding protein